MTVSKGRRAVIVGVATSDYPKLPEISEHAVHGQAADRALADAGLSMKEVDGFASTGFFPMYATGVAEYLGLHPTYYDETNAGGASFEVLAEHAAYAIESGAAETVLITYGSIQLSQMGRRLGTGGGGGGGFAPGPAIYDALWGNTLVGSYALAARRHMHQFGTTPEQLAAVAVTMREHAATNPQAQEREPITVDDVVSSPAGGRPPPQARLLRHLRRRRGLRDDHGRAGRRDHPGRTSWAPPPRPHPHEHLGHARLDRLPGGPVRATAFARAGSPRPTSTWPSSTTPSPSPCPPVEDLGFCAKGEGGPSSERRPRSRRALPTNTDGGGLSACHPGMRGMFLIVEAVRQLRGEGGPPRCPDAPSPWPTAPGACSRPAPPSSSGRTHRDTTPPTTRRPATGPPPPTSVRRNRGRHPSRSRLGRRTGEDSTTGSSSSSGVRTVRPFQLYPRDRCLACRGPVVLVEASGGERSTLHGDPSELRPTFPGLDPLRRRPRRTGRRTAADDQHHRHRSRAVRIGMAVRATFDVVSDDAGIAFSPRPDHLGRTRGGRVDSSVGWAPSVRELGAPVGFSVGTTAVCERISRVLSTDRTSRHPPWSASRVGSFLADHSGRDNSVLHMPSPRAALRHGAPDVFEGIVGPLALFCLALSWPASGGTLISPLLVLRGRDQTGPSRRANHRAPHARHSSPDPPDDGGLRHRVGLRLLMQRLRRGVLVLCCWLAGWRHR